MLKVNYAHQLCLFRGYAPTYAPFDGGYILSICFKCHFMLAGHDFYRWSCLIYDFFLYVVQQVN